MGTDTREPAQKQAGITAPRHQSSTPTRNPMLQQTHTNRPLPAVIGCDILAVFMRRAAAPAIGAHGHRSEYA